MSSTTNLDRLRVTVAVIAARAASDVAIDAEIEAALSPVDVLDLCELASTDPTRARVALALRRERKRKEDSALARARPATQEMVSVPLQSGGKCTILTLMTREAADAMRRG